MQAQQADTSLTGDNALSPAPRLAGEELLTELERMKQCGTPILNGGDATARLLAALFAFQGFAPFWSAFTGALGKQLGESTSQVMRRIRLRRIGERASIEVHGQRTSTIGIKRSAQASRHLLQLEFNPEELSDDARLAMLDIDFGSPHLQDKVLRWSTDAGAWIPVPPRQSAEDH